MKIKKIISGMIAASIMTAAIFSANADIRDTAEGAYNGISFYGELSYGGNISSVTATTMRDAQGYCYAKIYIQYKTNADEAAFRSFEYEADGPGIYTDDKYTKSATITDNSAPGSIDILFYSKGTHSIGGGAYAYTEAGTREF